MDEIKLNSVNFEHGMLLSPDHFIRQERFIESSVFWLLRYATDAWGVVGAGARADEGARGAVRHDPAITVANEEEFVQVTVSSCRAITPSGCIVEIGPEDAVSRRFAKADLEGVTLCGVYLIAVPEQKEAVDGVADSFNPQMQTERRAVYRLGLENPARRAGDSLVVARLRKSRQGTAYERDASYIPPCVSMLSHSELAAGWRRITEEVARLHERMIDLHRAMPEFLSVFRERGVDTEVDAASMSLVAAVLGALQLCLHEIMDPAQSPLRFFQHLRRLFHFAALQIELSPHVQGYFELLRDSGEEDFVSLIEAQRRAARTPVQARNADDLGLEVRTALRAIADLSRIEAALEGKYLDFRTNRSLESMNFIFERGGRALYRLAAKPARTQAAEGDFVITFAQLRLEGRDKYRLVLVAERNASFEVGTQISVELRINEGSGFRRAPTIVSSEAKLFDQRNFEFDFEAPDVPVISDLRVVFPAHHAIHTAMLYTRQRFYANAPQERPLRELEPQRPEPQPERTAGPRRSIPQPGNEARPDPLAARERRLTPVTGDSRAPSEGRRDDEPPPPPRRRRLD